MPLLIITFLIILDQLSKYLVRHWGGFYICNSGIAFGLIFPPIIFWLFWISIITFIVFQIFNFQFSMSKPALYLILAGAVSNIIDRLYFNCIIDFININFWPTIFNLADVFIVMGAMILLIKILRIKN